MPLGTLQVRNYLAEVGRNDDPDEIPQIELSRRFPTSGPRNRFGAILFIEKEGFKPLLDAARIAERFDIAIMSTKGMSVTAARQLVENSVRDHDIPLLVLHDFDVSGFTIAGTLQELTRRYQFTRVVQASSISACGSTTSMASSRRTCSSRTVPTSTRIGVDAARDTAPPRTRSPSCSSSSSASSSTR